MKKILAVLLLVLCPFFLFSQQKDEILPLEQDLQEEENSDFDDVEDVDDLDAFFNDSEDVDLDEIENNQDKNSKNETEKAGTTAIVQNISKAIKFSGHITADVGFAAMIDKEGFTPGGYLNFKNYLYIDVSPVDIFKIHGSLYTAFTTPYNSSSFKLELNDLYFDYFLLNRLYISAGKKSETWGFTRLFNNTDYYGTGTDYTKRNGPQYTNIMADSKNYASVQLKYPWNYGNLSFTGMYNYAGIGNNVNLSNANMIYAVASDFVFWHTNLNLFARFYGENPDSEVTKHPMFGLEIKRTIAGFDVYGQGIAMVKDFAKLNNGDGYDFITGTAGFYRLWNKSMPEFGVNFEYQVAYQKEIIEKGPYAYTPANKYTHRTALEAGIKLGQKKNHKIGLEWNHNYTEMKGQVGLNYKIAGLLPCVQINNAALLYYGSDLSTPDFKFVTALSFDAKY